MLHSCESQGSQFSALWTSSAVSVVNLLTSIYLRKLNDRKEKRKSKMVRVYVMMLSLLSLPSTLSECCGLRTPPPPTLPVHPPPLHPHPLTLPTQLPSLLLTMSSYCSRSLNAELLAVRYWTLICWTGAPCCEYYFIIGVSKSGWKVSCSPTQPQ